MTMISLTERWYDQKLAENVQPEARSTSGQEGSEKRESKALEQLAAFFPVDVITLYVATIGFLSAAAGAGKGETDRIVLLVGGISPWWVYLGFAFIVTPALAWLSLLIKRKEAKQDGQSHVPGFPWWPLCAAIIAFLAWALAVPGLIANDILKVGASVVALLVSVILTQIDRLFS